MPDSTAQLMGYRFLCERHGVACLPCDVESFVLRGQKLPSFAAIVQGLRG